MRPLQGLSRRFWFLNSEPDTDHPASLHAEIMRRVAVGDTIGAINASNSLIEYLVQQEKEKLER